MNTLTYTDLNGTEVQISVRQIQDLGIIGVFLTDNGTMISAAIDDKVFDVTDGQQTLIGTEAGF